jgi:hypothetical protein
MSKTPRVASVSDLRINYGIEIRELRGIDPYRPPCGIGDDRSRHKATSPDGPQLSDRRTVSAHDECLPGLHLTKHRGRSIAKLSLE